MATNEEFPSTIILLDGTKVTAPKDWDPRKPDPAIISRLENEHASRSTNED